jgi:menaquinone-dependent protoporphyrinogen IX oxidase
VKQKTLIVYATKTGINSDVAHIIAEVLETKYDVEVTVADFNDGQPDITPFQNVIGEALIERRLPSSGSS